MSQELSDVTSKILAMYGFDDKSGLPMDGVVLSDSITSVSGSLPVEIDEAKVADAITAVNETREEKISFLPENIQIESTPSDCVYVSIDDIGVKHQKDTRKEGSIRDYKYVENTVAHIQYGDKSYVLTGIGMLNVFRSVLAFLLVRSLLLHQ